MCLSPSLLFCNKNRSTQQDGGDIWSYLRSEPILNNAKGGKAQIQQVSNVFYCTLRCCVMEEHLPARLECPQHFLSTSFGASRD